MSNRSEFAGHPVTFSGVPDPDDPVAQAAAAPDENRHVLTFYAGGVVGQGTAQAAPVADNEKEH